MKARRFVIAVAFAALVCCLAAAATPQRVGGTARRAAARAAQTASVTIKNFAFEPKAITVKPGTTVTWTNTAGSHTVTADNGSFDSGTLSNGQTYSRKFSKRGTYRYYCSFHGEKGGSDMAGTVIVKP